MKAAYLKSKLQGSSRVSIALIRMHNKKIIWSWTFLSLDINVSGTNSGQLYSFSAFRFLEFRVRKVCVLLILEHWGCKSDFLTSVSTLTIGVFNSSSHIYIGQLDKNLLQTILAHNFTKKFFNWYDLTSTVRIHHRNLRPGNKTCGLRYLIQKVPSRYIVIEGGMRWSRKISETERTSKREQGETKQVAKTYRKQTGNTQKRTERKRTTFRYFLTKKLPEQ